MSFAATHPYLLGNVVWLAALLGYWKWGACRPHARSVLFSGLACLPCAPLALMHEGSYWSPVRWLPWPVGPEDFLFTFVAGATVWLVATYAWRHSMPESPNAGIVIRGSILCAAGVLLTLGLRGCGVHGLANSIAAAIVLWTALMIYRPAYRRLALTGVAAFVPLYVLIVVAQFRVWPAYVRQWNPANPLCSPVCGIPVGELLWGVAFACVWPAAVAAAWGWAPPSRPVPAAPADRAPAIGTAQTPP